jgi:hypothetical protein
MTQTDDTKRLTRGTVNAEGKVFWDYNRGKERWYHPKTFALIAKNARVRFARYREKHRQRLIEHNRKYHAQNRERGITENRNRRNQHGGAYRIWANLRAKCFNPKNKSYSNYGGRGITICDEWRSYPAFIADMGARPSRDQTIQRRDLNGNYNKSNCFWGKILYNSLKSRGQTFNNDELC